MPQESTNIFVKGLHDKYIQRPDFLESLCLADFAATFEFSKTSRISRQRENSDNKGDDRDLGGYITLRDAIGFIREKRQPCIIRYRSFNINTDRPHYFSVLSMLYFPCRNKEVELVGRNCEEFYNLREATIKVNY